MIEGIIDAAPWAAAFIVAVIAICITVSSVVGGQQKTERYTACVKAGGTVTKVEDNVPFCQARR